MLTRLRKLLKRPANRRRLKELRDRRLLRDIGLENEVWRFDWHRDASRAENRWLL